MDTRTRRPWRSPPSFLASTLALALTLAGAAPAAAQSIPDSAYSAMRWRMIGPFRAGRVLAASGIPGNPSTFYFGAVAGGVWKTDNAGVTWQPLFDGEPIASIGALAIGRSDPSVLYVGTGEADMRSDITYGNGVYKSTDGGAHWRHVGLEDTRQIGKVLVDPKNPDIVLVAALGHAYGPNEQRGVFRSADGGQTWTKVLYKDENTGAVDLAWDPTNPDVVYATLWNARRPPWSQYPPDEGPGSGIYKSTDEGRTWTELTGHGLPAGPLGRVGVTVSGDRVYAIVEVQAGGGTQGGGPASAKRGRSGLYRSDDGGTSWRFMSDDARITTRMWYFGRLFVDPTNPDVVYLPNRGIVRTEDGGRTFTTIKSEPGGDDYHYLWVDPTDGARMIFGSDQGAGISLDRGKTWSSWYNQPTAQFYHVVTDNQFPYWVYGAQQDAGTVAIRSRSDYGLITFRDWHPVGAGEAGYIAPDPKDPDIVFGGDTYGGVYRFDTRTGQRQDISPTPTASFGTPMSQRTYRFTWTSPIVFDPLDPNTLYLGAQVILKTTDGGLHWDSASPDLTSARPGTPDEGPLTVQNAGPRGHAVVYTIAPSPVKEGVIWAGTDDGLIQLTTDGGAHWRNVTPPDLKPWSKISLIDASHTDAQTAYAAVDRHRLDDVNPYIYRTRDGGAHWDLVVDGIPYGAFVRAVRADPVRKGLLYAGTELGVYVSFDDGDHWQPLQLNLPVTPVRDLAVHENDLIAATHGRAFWILDDVTPLRQLTADVVKEDVHLFRPAPAVRLRRNESHDTPLPPEEPHGENPPAGAVIDYWLGSAPAGPVKLDIVDGQGHVVRSFASTDTATPPARPPFFTDWWLPRFRPLTTHAGHNRFVWNLRYPPPPAPGYSYSISAIAGHGTIAVPQGPLVRPGTYTARLTVGGHTETQPLEVKADPRVSVPDSVFAHQLDLALDIWHSMADAMALQQSIDGVGRQLLALDRKGLDRQTLSTLDALDDRLADLRPARLAGTMGSLEEVVTGADREPPQQARDAYALLKRQLTVQQHTWQEVVEDTLPALNRRLRAQGRTALTTPER
ncbi:MAG: hypothetical protein P8099_05190 [Gemmatimonadota bacterium]|jgi:photosystem II stability/assembly factor-like uncharacterized protein